MKLPIFWFSLLAFPLTSIACGNSPLLNHTTAGAAPEVIPPAAGGLPAAECPNSFPVSGLCASLTWDNSPSAEQQNAFTLRLWSKETGSAGGPYKDAENEVGVQLWMPSMGHGSSPVEINHTGLGVYSVSRVFFIMPGTWEVRIQLKKNHQLVEQTVIGISL